MRLGLRSTSLLVVAIALAALAGLSCGKKREPLVPRKENALEQYFYARATWLEPGFKRRGNERQRQLRLAIEGMREVIDGFPQDDAVVTRALAEYDTGLCYRALGETDRAREAYLRVRDYKRFSLQPSLHQSARDELNAIIDAAHERVRELEGRNP